MSHISLYEYNCMFAGTLPANVFHSSEKSCSGNPNEKLVCNLSDRHRSRCCCRLHSTCFFSGFPTFVVSFFYTTTAKPKQNLSQQWNGSLHCRGRQINKRQRGKYLARSAATTAAAAATINVKCTRECLSEWVCVSTHRVFWRIPAYVSINNCKLLPILVVVFFTCFFMLRQYIVSKKNKKKSGKNFSYKEMLHKTSSGSNNKSNVATVKQAACSRRCCCFTDSLSITASARSLLHRSARSLCMSVCPLVD